jgi:hypothetical protein
VRAFFVLAHLRLIITMLATTCALEGLRIFVQQRRFFNISLTRFHEPIEY